MFTLIRLRVWFLLACPIIWFIFFPQDPKFTFTDATLSKFNFTNHNDTLDYHLTLNITIINPNKKAGIIYRHIEVVASYRNKMFGFASLPSQPFGQCFMSIPILHHVALEGKKLVLFEEKEISQYNSETATGVYSIKVILDFGLEILSSGKFFKTTYSNPSHKIDCKLKVPLQFGETSANQFTFETTKCRTVISVQILKRRAQAVLFFLGNPLIEVLMLCVYLYLIWRA